MKSSIELLLKHPSKTHIFVALFQHFFYDTLVYRNELKSWPSDGFKASKIDCHKGG